MKVSRNLKNRSGSVIVEAAVYFPLVIGAVVSVLYIVIGLYQSVAIQSSIHMALRELAGEKTGTVTRTAENMKYNYKEQSIGLRKVLYMTEDHEYSIDTIFRNKFTRQESGRYYLVDETGVLRIITL